jgi:tight adherence protein C
MIMLMLLAAGIGLGLWVVVVALVPPRPSLAVLIAKMNTAPPRPQILVTSAGGWAARVGRPLTGLLRGLGLPGKRLARDLAVTGRSIDVYLAEKAALALAGLFLPVLLEVALNVGGRPMPAVVPMAVSVAAGVTGFLLPDATVRAEAVRRRAAFRHALSAYLSLIHILLAGGAGVDGSLREAATIGCGWSFQQLRRAVTTAEITRTTTWDTLGQLGDELDITELTELAAALALAGTEGAKVRGSLAAKSTALRGKEGQRCHRTYDHSWRAYGSGVRFLRLLPGHGPDCRLSAPPIAPQ